jgi:hypothetical protein
VQWWGTEHPLATKRLHARDKKRNPADPGDRVFDMATMEALLEVGRWNSQTAAEWLHVASDHICNLQVHPRRDITQGNIGSYRVILHRVGATSSHRT